jgi:hypothetical protein
MNGKPNIQSWITVAISSAMLFLSFMGAVGSFYKSLSAYQQTASDLKQETQKVIAFEIKDLRNEIKANYATKEDIAYINKSMTEMNGNIKEIMRTLISSEILALESKIREQGKNKYGEERWNKKADEVMDIIRRKGVKLDKAWKIANEEKLKKKKAHDYSFLN